MSKRIKILSILSLVIALLCSFTAIALTYANSNYNFTFEGSLKEKYSIGETIEIPTAKIGDTVADFVVHIPDGTATNAKSFKAKKNGTYVVEYTADNGAGKLANTTLSFEVLNTMFSVDGKGYAEYREVNSTQKGMYAKLQKGDTLNYNGIIDLNDFTASDPLFRMRLLPSVVGEEDVTNFELRLTDAYDESIYLVFRFKKHHEFGQYDYTVSYVDCGFEGAPYVGLTSTTKVTSYKYNGTYYNASKNSEKYGTTHQISMTGGTQAKPVNTEFGIMYDKATGLVYIISGPSYKLLITDLNSVSMYGKKFPGFTDGKIKLSVTPTVYSKSTCGIFFSEIGGMKVTNVNCNSFSSVSSPEIDIDFAGQSENNLPNAKQGLYYPVFNATAFDVVDGDVDVDTKVYYGYSNQNKIRVDIVDGKFLANRIGDYTIVYTARNSAGGQTVKTVKVESVAGNGEVSINLTDEYDYTKSANIGTKIKLFDDYTISNCYGNPKFDVAIKHKDDLANYTLDEDNCFTPLYAGDYVITYTYGDYITTKTFEKEIKVVQVQTIRYELAENLNKYFIKFGQYNVNVVKAYNLETGKPVEVPVTTYYKNDSDTIQKKVDGKLTVNAESNVQLIYQPTIGYSVEPYVIDVPVVNTGYGSASINKIKYFAPYLGESSFTSNVDGVNWLFDNAEDNNIGIEFINVLRRDEFDIMFAPVFDNGVFNRFDRINVYLTDSVDNSKFIKLSLFYQNDMWVVSLNDCNPIMYKTEWGNVGDTFTATYASRNKTVKLGGNAFTVDCFYGTEVPVQFEKGVMLSVEVEGVNDCSGVVIKKINGQAFDDSKYDYGVPSIDSTKDRNKGEREINTTITLGDFYVYDVLSPNVEASLTVRGPSGVVKTIDGVNLSGKDPLGTYQFILTEYGQYTVTVLANDTNTNEQPYLYNIFVNNNVEPEITLSGVVLNGKTNSEVSLPKVTVDRELGTYTVYYTIVCPNAKVLYTKSNSFKTTIAGRYVVTVAVLDANNNLAERNYIVTVK